MHRFEVKQQFIGRYGRYAEIMFEISIDEGKPAGRIVNFYAEDSIRWELACRAGTAIFFDYYTPPGEVTINIMQIVWRPGDTTHITILYAIVKGLSEAFDAKIPSLHIDASQETFVFPARRK